jgi:hypothetical protein
MFIKSALRVLFSVAFLFVPLLIHPLLIHAQQSAWVELGNSQLDGVTDHETIGLQESKGFFRDIQLRVSGGPVILHLVRVNYRNGSSQEIAVALAISAGDHTPAITLSGDRRIIKSVDIWYSKETWPTKPHVSLYAMPETRRSFLIYK